MSVFVEATISTFTVQQDNVIKNMCVNVGGHLQQCVLSSEWTHPRAVCCWQNIHAFVHCIQRQLHFIEIQPGFNWLNYQKVHPASEHAQWCTGIHLH